MVAGGVGYVLSQSGSSGQTSSGSAASASSARPKPTHRSAIKAGPNVPPGSHAIRPNTPSGTRYVQSGTDYRPGALAGQTKNTLAQYDVPGLSGPGMLPATRVSGSVHNCVNQLALGRPVRLVDLAHYQRQPGHRDRAGRPGHGDRGQAVVLHEAALRSCRDFGADHEIMPARGRAFQGICAP